MPVDFINISSIWPDGTTLGVNGSLNIVGASPQYLVNGNPMGLVSTVSPGSLSGDITLAAGANMSITQAGQTITFASTGGGSGGTSQWVDAVGGGIYYGGHVGILTAAPDVALDVNGYLRVRSSTGWPSGGSGLDLYFSPVSVTGFVNSYNASGGSFNQLDLNGNPVTINSGWSSANVGIGTPNPSMGSLQIARSDGAYQLVLERSGPNDPQIYGIGISGTPGAPSLALQDITHSWATRVLIAPNGNVGIGTAGPQAALHVLGPFNYDPSITPGSPAAFILGNAVGGELAAGILSGGPYSYWLQARAAGPTGLPLVLNPSAGNVGIGTTNPGARLEIVPVGGAGTLTAPGFNNQLVIRESGGNPAYGLAIGYINWQAAWTGSIQSYDANNPHNLLLNPLGGNIGIGTGNPSAQLHVVGNAGGTGIIVENPLAPYCLAIAGSASSTRTWLGTDGSGNLQIYDNSGAARCMLTQGGTMTVNAGGPFDPGNPHLQVVGGLSVNSMADNFGATLRLISQDQAWGFLFHYPNQIMYIGRTNVGDAYGNSAQWFTSIDCASGNVNIPTLYVNNIYRQNVELVPPPPPSAGWNMYTPGAWDGTGVSLNPDFIVGRYSVFASWCAIMISIRYNPIGRNQTAIYIDPPPVNLYPGVALAGYLYPDPGYRVLNAEYIGSGPFGALINVQMAGTTGYNLVQLRISGVCELQG